MQRRPDLSPIFIIGSGRSGNTLVRRILFNHPDIYIPPETYVLGPSIHTFRENAHLNWNTLTRLVLSYFSLSKDFGLFPTQVLRPLHQELLALPRNERTYDNLVDRFYMYMAGVAKPDATVWGDKTPINSFNLDDIFAAFPNGRFIHIIRDGFDVVESYINAGIYRAREDAAKRWLQSVQLCQNFKKRAPTCVFELYYEDVVRYPDRTLWALFEFLGMTYNSDFLDAPKDPAALGDLCQKALYANVAHDLSAAPIGKGRRNMPSVEAKFIASIISDKMTELGYS